MNAWIKNPNRQAMLTSESFKSLFTHSPTAMLVEGEDGGVRDANASACKLFGTKRDDIIGRQSTELIPADASLSGFPQGSQRLGSLSSKSGSTMRVSMHSAPIDTASETASLISIWPTTQNGVETDGYAAKETGRNNIQLASQHIANVLSDSLTPIQGFVSLAQEDLRHGRIRSTHLQQIARAADRGATFARELFAFGSIAPEQVESLSLGEPLDAWKQELLDIAGDKITMTFNISQGTPDINISRKDFRTIMRHAIRNAAADADNNRSIEITCSTESENATQHLLTSRPATIITINDNAPPLNEDSSTHAFEPFYGLPQREDPNGLRLPIVKQLMSNHGGTIQLSSSPEEGTTLKLTFPHTRH